MDIIKQLQLDDHQLHIIDHADVNTNETKQRDVVKRVKVKITYKFKNQEQNVELSTILSKES